MALGFDATTLAQFGMDGHAAVEAVLREAPVASLMAPASTRAAAIADVARSHAAFLRVSEPLFAHFVVASSFDPATCASPEIDAWSALYDAVVAGP